MKPTTATTNLVFLGTTDAFDRTCECGKVRAVHKLAGKRRTAPCAGCETCGCQVELHSEPTAPLVERLDLETAPGIHEHCEWCGNHADARVELQDRGEARFAPVCLDCLERIDAEDFGADYKQTAEWPLD